MMISTRPDRDEASDYYFKYIDLVPDGDIGDVLAAQLPATLELLNRISEEGSRHRYAPGKWSIRQVLGHLNDAERLFVFRAFWIARGLDSPQPSFDPDVAAQHDTADERPWSSLVQEFEAIRASTLSFLRYLPPDAWSRRGIASDHTFSVRALACIAAGHVIHHVEILKARYLVTVEPS
jgi:hypothetical protein